MRNPFYHLNGPKFVFYRRETAFRARIPCNSGKMGDQFYKKEDVRKINVLAQLVPETMQALVEVNDKVFQEGALSTKTKELIAIAVAHVTSCAYCIDIHTKNALRAGASEEEIAESIMVGVVMKASSALSHSVIAVNAIDEFHSLAHHLKK
jgi:AhpD family alkylhydroperoxidase